MLLNMLDNTIRTPEDLQFLLALPNLGVVPSFESEQRKETAAIDISTRQSLDLSPSNLPAERFQAGELPRPLIFLNEPRSLAAEAYRTIRTGILLSQAGEPPRTILVTSAQSSEGKTTTSINIAASLAGAGARVALIDADLRRPSLAAYLGMERYTPGLVEVITGQATLASVGISHVIKRVTIFAAGSIPPNPAELLGSLEMASILDRMSADFDYVLIDSPPILPVTDSVILSRYVDGVVMVVKGGNTPQKVVKDARDRLQAVGARILGSVLNDIDLNGTDYYYYNRYYHSYYQDDESTDEHSGRVSI
jgi:capsular exopolysaccharide synthesis family protein